MEIISREKNYTKWKVGLKIMWIYLSLTCFGLPVKIGVVSKISFHLFWATITDNAEAALLIDNYNQTWMNYHI